jgi:hypothetical protein
VARNSATSSYPSRPNGGVATPPLVELPAAREVKVLRSWASLENMRDPGRVADIIITHVAAPLGDKQELLATLDPVARLEKADAMLAARLGLETTKGPLDRHAGLTRASTSWPA